MCLQLSQEKHLFQAVTAISGSSSAEEGGTKTNAYWKYSESILIE